MKIHSYKTVVALLSKKAEELLKVKPAKTGAKLSEVDMLKLVHELEVHQIELEMMNAQLLENEKIQSAELVIANKELLFQNSEKEARATELLVMNEELNLAHLREAELAENKYVKLYDFAPTSYFTLSKEGEIFQLNLAGAALLGKERSKLLQARFGFFVSEDTKPAFNAFLEKVFYNNVNKFCEVTLVRNSKERLTVQLIGIANENSGECSISAVDITERIKAEETSRANEIRYRTLYTKAIDGIMFLSLDSKIATVNESFAKMHGYTVDELQNMSLQDLDTSETSRNVSERISRISSGETITFEVEHYHKDGHIIILEVSASLVSIGNEKIIQSFHRDITERKQAEESLSKTTRIMGERVKELDCIYNIAELVRRKDVSQEIMWLECANHLAQAYMFNEVSACRITFEDCEYSTTKFRKTTWSQSRPIVVHGNQVGSIEVCYLEKRPNEYAGPFLLEEEKLITAVAGVIEKSIERKQAEVLLENEHLRLQGIIEGTNAGTWEWNIQTGEIVINQKWAEIVGYMPEELSPVSIKTWETLTHPDDMKKSALLLEQHFKREQLNYTCECRMKHKDGSWVWILDRGRVITRTAEGKPLKMFGTHTDISQSKKGEEERERLIAELQSALAEVKTLTGIIPICANCKKIRDDKGFWEQVESYVSHHTNAQFSHGICPSCVEKIYPEQAERLRNRLKE